MAFTILPRADDSGGAAAAQAQLQTIIDDVRTVVMIVYGEGTDIERVIEVAVGRATIPTIPPDLRRVVWCPDPGALSAEQKKRYFRKNKVAVAVGIDNKIADALDIDEAQSGLSMELAFQRAVAQGEGGDGD